MRIWKRNQFIIEMVLIQSNFTVPFHLRCFKRWNLIVNQWCFNFCTKKYIFIEFVHFCEDQYYGNQIKIPILWIKKKSNVSHGPFSIGIWKKELSRCMNFKNVFYIEFSIVKNYIRMLYILSFRECIIKVSKWIQKPDSKSKNHIESASESHIEIMSDFFQSTSLYSNANCVFDVFEA